MGNVSCASGTALLCPCTARRRMLPERWQPAAVLTRAARAALVPPGTSAAGCTWIDQYFSDWFNIDHSVESAYFRCGGLLPPPVCSRAGKRQPTQVACLLRRMRAVHAHCPPQAGCGQAAHVHGAVREGQQGWVRWGVAGLARAVHACNPLLAARQAALPEELPSRARPARCPQARRWRGGATRTSRCTLARWQRCWSAWRAASWTAATSTWRSARCS